MVQLRTIEATKPSVSADKLGYFNYGQVAGRVILSNDAGDWHFLDEDDFQVFLRGDLDPKHSDYEALVRKGFIRDGWDVEETATKVRRKKRFLSYGPHLHIVISTLRCNQSCKYCHASRTSMDRVDTDMSEETARNVVHHAFESTSPYINFEFQGGGADGEHGRHQVHRRVQQRTQ